MHELQRLLPEVLALQAGQLLQAGQRCVLPLQVGRRCVLPLQAGQRPVLLAQLGETPAG